MPAGSTLLVFALSALALIVIPGPNLIYIATRGVAEGRRSAVVSALGIEAGSLVHVAAAAVGLSALLASSATAFNVVKYVGAAYLVVLGVQALRRRERLSLEAAPASGGLGRVFGQGVLVNTLNPKVALFFLAFLPQFVDPAAGPVVAQVLVLGAVMVVLGVLVDMSLALASGALGARLRRSPRFLGLHPYLTGGVYLAMGAGAALAHPGRTR